MSRQTFTTTIAFRTREETKFSLFGENFTIPGRVSNPSLVLEVAEAAREAHVAARAAKGLPPLFDKFGATMWPTGTRGRYDITVWCD